MFLWDVYPYTNFHELNLDWVLERVKANEGAVEALTKTVNSLPGVDSALPPSPYINIEDYITEEGGRNNVTYAIAKMLDEGHRYIFLPPGTYRFNWPANSGEFHLRGSGSNGTTIQPATTDPLFRFTGTVDYSSIEGLHAINIQSGWMITDGIRIESGAQWDHAFMQDVVFENFRYGFVNYGRVIWGLFSKCAFIGSSDSALESSTSVNSPFNNNTFINCRFNNNRNRALNIASADRTGAIGNSFFGCNIEQNLLPSNAFGNPTDGVKEAVRLSAACSTLFSGCYFESNTNHGYGERAILVYDLATATFDGCSFTLEQNALVWGGGNSTITMIGCSGNNNGRFAVKDYASAFFVKVVNSYMNTTSPAPKYRQAYLDFRYGDTIYFNGTSAEIVLPSDKSEPLWLIAEENATIAGSIMESGSNFSIEKGKVYNMIIKGGKISIG